MTIKELAEEMEIESKLEREENGDFDGESANPDLDEDDNEPDVPENL